MKALTDEQGAFVFEHAPPDPLDLSAMASGYVPMQRQLKADEDLLFELRKLEPRQAAGPESKIGVGAMLPELELATLDGEKIDLATLRGKVVLLDFWATWCGPCRLELPYVKKVHESFGGRADFMLLGISLDQRESVLREFIKKEQFGWPQVQDSASGGGTVADAFGVQGIPATFLVGKDGKVIAVGLRGEQMKAEVEKALR
jgi:peroxiredoxin